MRSKRILRQLKKAFGEEGLEEALSSIGPLGGNSLSPEAQALVENLCQNLPEFLNGIETTYSQLDDKANMAQRSLELSSAELTESNTRLYTLNQTFDAILNTLGEGLAVFDKDGIGHDIYSQACEHLLESNPKGKHLADVLKIPSEKLEAFKDWYNLLFQELLDFEDVLPLGPKRFSHSEGKIVQLSFKPVRNAAKVIEYILMIATDLTEQEKTRARVEELESYATLVSNILKNKDRFVSFIHSFREGIGRCMQIANTSEGNDSDISSLKTLMHQLKGSAGVFGLFEVNHQLHAAETKLVELQSKRIPIQSLCEDIQHVWLTFEEVLKEHTEILGSVEKNVGVHRQISMDKLLAFDALLQDPAQKDLRKEFMAQFVTSPLWAVFEQYNSTISQTALYLKKSVNELKFVGDNFPLIPENYTNVLSDLHHIFRNIVDHGMDPPDQRLAKRKSEAGNIVVESRLVDGQIEITISDDGNGINEEYLASVVQAKGIKFSNREDLLDSIFLEDISTAKKITKLSGRGVGLFAVRKAIEQKNGKIWVSSVPQKGTTFHIRLPYLSDFEMPLGKAA